MVRPNQNITGAGSAGDTFHEDNRLTKEVYLPILGSLALRFVVLLSACGAGQGRRLDLRTHASCVGSSV